MRHLESPEKRARGSLQSDHRIRPLVVAGTRAAVVIGTCAAGRDEHHVARRVGGKRGPRIGCAGPHLLLFRPGNRVPRPAQCSGARVVGTHYSAGHIDRVIVGDRGSGDHQVRDNGRRGGDLITAAELGPVHHAASEVHRAARAELLAWLAGLAIDRDQPRIDGPLKDAHLARRAVRGFGIAPVRHAARAYLGIIVRAIDLRIVGPLLRAARRIQRDHAIERRAEIERAFDQNRGGLESRLLVEFGFRLQRAGVISPHGPKLHHVSAGDLLEGRVAGAGRIASVNAPATIGRKHGRGNPHKGKCDSHKNEYSLATTTLALSSSYASLPASPPRRSRPGGRRQERPPSNHGCARRPLRRRLAQNLGIRRGRVQGKPERRTAEVRAACRRISPGGKCGRHADGVHRHLGPGQAR